MYDNVYSVGIKGSGMNSRIPKAPHIYQIDVIDGDNFIEKLLETMAVTFVKYNFFTVMPYPIKYLNEYIYINVWEFEITFQTGWVGLTLVSVQFF